MWFGGVDYDGQQLRPDHLFSMAAVENHLQMVQFLMHDRQRILPKSDMTWGCAAWLLLPTPLPSGLKKQKTKAPKKTRRTLAEGALWVRDSRATDPELKLAVDAAISSGNQQVVEYLVGYILGSHDLPISSKFLYGRLHDDPEEIFRWELLMHKCDQAAEVALDVLLGVGV